MQQRHSFFPYISNSFLYISIVTVPHKQVGRKISYNRAKIIKEIDRINNNNFS